MNCKVCEYDNYIGIWVPHNVEESELDALLARCRGRGLPIVVYRSGHGDLGDLTAMLLTSNSYIPARNKCASVTETGQVPGREQDLKR